MDRNPFAPAVVTRLEKAAFDSGFDQDIGVSDGWLAFASTHTSLRIWLTTAPSGRPTVGLSRRDVAGELSSHGRSSALAGPPGTEAVLEFPDVPTVHRVLRRAFQLSRALPTAMLDQFEAQTANMPRVTEVERLVVQRVGQDIFRAGLMDYWDGKCAVTALAIPKLLRASHTKPWAECATDAERLDVFNGFLLETRLDAAFDAGFITFADDGEVQLSTTLTQDDARALELGGKVLSSRPTPKHRAYLQWHREHVFKG